MMKKLIALLALSVGLTGCNSPRRYSYEYLEKAMEVGYLKGLEEGLERTKKAHEDVLEAYRKQLLLNEADKIDLADYCKFMADLYEEKGDHEKATLYAIMEMRYRIQISEIQNYFKGEKKEK